MKRLIPVVLLATLTACSGASTVATSPTPMTTGGSGTTGPQPRTVVTGLKTPWGIGFLPNGSALVTERDSATVVMLDGSGRQSRLGVVNGVHPQGEGGLLGIAISPEFASDQTIFVYYTAGSDNRIATLKLTDGTLSNQRDILTGIPAAGRHNGGRMTFGPDGLLYVGTGDAGDTSHAQDPHSLGGKILRITPTGKPAPTNPDPTSPVFSMGHRNVQGLAFDERGRLWASEFGQDAYDELNLIVAGGNYGWPTVEGTAPDTRFGNPERVWKTSDASPSGIAVRRGSVWMAGLGGRTLWQIPLSAKTTGPQTLSPIAHYRAEFGRLRTVVVAPGNTLWVSTSNTDGRGAPSADDDRILALPARS